MATSRYESEQYTSEAFVESAGAIMFRLSTREICILRKLDCNEYVLAKGRRNCGETRQRAALREIAEETGFTCRLLPLNMVTRTPPELEIEELSDEARFYTGICEPFNLQIRHLGKGNIKLIFWYIATIDEEQPIMEELQEKEKFAVEFHNYTDVLEKLTFVSDISGILPNPVDL